MVRFVGRNKQPTPPKPPEVPSSSGEAGYSAAVFINRRKVYEERTATEDEAYSKAKAKAATYPNERTSVLVRKVK